MPWNHDQINHDERRGKEEGKIEFTAEVGIEIQCQQFSEPPPPQILSSCDIPQDIHVRILKS
jgi:hypothetical protein